MALSGRSLFLYGYQVTANNRSIDFQRVALGPELQATLTLGFYSLTSLMAEVKRAMQTADPLNTYTVTAVRTANGNTENRVTIATSGGFLSLLFASGSRAASTVAPLIGFTSTDKTGFTTYTGTMTSGTVLIPNANPTPNLPGFNFLPPTAMRKNFGNLNVSASGKKEAIVYSTQFFWQVQFKYITQTDMEVYWSQLNTWMISQRLIEFTPDISSPNIFYNGTLESSAADPKGMAYTMTEMLPSFPNLYDTGLMKFRVRS